MKTNETLDFKNLNETPSSERIHIAFFGLRNAGKSSLVNAVTGQELSIVSEIKGTTTDPVKKAMELFSAGAVLVVDTPGLDDEGELGERRVARAFDALESCDIAVFVHALEKTDEKNINENELLKNFSGVELDFLAQIKAKGKPYLIICNKSDTILESADEIEIENEKIIFVSALTGKNIDLLKTRIAEKCKASKPEKKIIADLLTPGDFVLLVVPIDKAAPKGRLILPQQQTIREILDSKCIAVCCGENEITHVLQTVKPRIVVTDSQVFKKVNEVVPTEIPLTSFSILFARYKGDLKILTEGAEKIKSLKNGDKVLISEACTHCKISGDIGSEKIPKMLKRITGADLEFSFTMGGSFPDEDKLKEFSLVVHCGGCMLNEAGMKSRIEKAVNSQVPIVNYGVALAFGNGILKRATEMFY